MAVDAAGLDLGFNSDHSDLEQTQTDAVQNIIVDIRDVVGLRKWHGRHKYRAQTWKQHIHRFNEAWAAIIDDLVKDYIHWKYGTSPPTSQRQPPPTAESSEWDFTVEVLDVYTLDCEATVHRDSDTKATTALVQAGYLAASPVIPSFAVSLRTLELLRTIRLFKPNFSIEAFAKVTCHLYAVHNTCHTYADSELTHL